MKLFVAFLAVAFNRVLSSPTTPATLPYTSLHTKPTQDYISQLVSNNILDVKTATHHKWEGPLKAEVTIEGDVSIKIFNNTHTCCSSRTCSKLPTGYTPISKDGGYLTGIKLYSPALVFNEARKICSHEGAFLAYATNKKEEDMYLQLMDDNRIIDVWSGIHDLFERFDWSTILGEAASEAAYFKWRPGQPDNAGGNERCTHVRREGLNDIACNGHFSFICKIKLPLCL